MPVLRAARPAALFLLAAAPLRAQVSHSAELLQVARSLIGAARADSALTVLYDALAAATTRSDSVTALVWTGIAHFYAAPDSTQRDSIVRADFHAAFALKPDLNVSNLEQASLHLARLFAAERPRSVYISGDVASPPRLQSGPPVAYPWNVWRRGVSGRGTIEGIVDTTGSVEPASLRIVAIPDSGLVEPVRRMILASLFTVGRLRDGTAVPTMIRMSIALTPGPPPNPTDLLNTGRRLASAQPDSALTLVDMALDSAVHATAGIRVYAFLVRGLARAAQGNDSLAAAALDTALAGYRDLRSRGVDLAPFLRRLADSVRFARRGGQRAVATMLRLLVQGTVDEPPLLISHPGIRYPPELWQLKVGGTVVVEATIDASGRVVPASIKVVQSANPGFDGEVRRVLLESVYRPGRRAGQAVTTVIRQPFTFAP